MSPPDRERATIQNNIATPTRNRSERLNALLLLSDVLTAEQALAPGLVNRLVSHDELTAATQETAGRIAQGPQVAYRYMQENVRMASQQVQQTLLDREAWTQVRTGDTEGHREGARALVEKRAPRFKGC